MIGGDPAARQAEIDEPNLNLTHESGFQNDAYVLPQTISAGPTPVRVGLSPCETPVRQLRSSANGRLQSPQPHRTKSSRSCEGSASTAKLVARAPASQSADPRLRAAHAADVQAVWPLVRELVDEIDSAGTARWAKLDASTADTRTQRRPGALSLSNSQVGPGPHRTGTSSGSKCNLRAEKGRYWSRVTLAAQRTFYRGKE